MKKLTDAIEKSAVGSAHKGYPSGITREYCFDNNFAGFNGHFPGYPILPAVLQLLLGQLLIEDQKGCKISVTSIEKAKFLSEIKPDDRITVQCVDADTKESRRSKIKISSGERPVSSFNLYFCPSKENANW